MSNITSNIKKLNIALETLNALERSMTALKHSRYALDFNGHQKNVSVSIRDCVNITVSYNDSQTGYSERPIEGMEMIILGAKKLYNQKIEYTKVKILECKLDISKIALNIS